MSRILDTSSERNSSKLHRTVSNVQTSKVQRGHWPLGRIEVTYPGTDGHVRAVDVRVKGQVMRPIVKLCPLELDGDVVPSEADRD